MLSIKTSFREKIAHLKSAKEMTSFLIVESVSLATTYPDVCTAYTMYSLKLNVPRETLLSIENERSNNLDFRKVIEQFANAKARQKNFKFTNTCK